MQCYAINYGNFYFTNTRIYICNTREEVIDFVTKQLHRSDLEAVLGDTYAHMLLYRVANNRLVDRMDLKYIMTVFGNTSTFDVNGNGTKLINAVIRTTKKRKMKDNEIEMELYSHLPIELASIIYEYQCEYEILFETCSLYADVGTRKGPIVIHDYFVNKKNSQASIKCEYGDITVPIRSIVKNQ